MRFNGKDFADFGVHVDESKAFGSPEKDYELVEIMGRNGNLSIYNDRFKDITLPFPCFIRTGFIEKYRSLLAYLNSQTGYQRLETDKEPNHFRKALFQGIVDPQTTAFNHGGFFTVNFLAHPQRFLKSGEIPVSASSQSNTYTGNPVEIDNPSGLSAVSSLTVALNPQQNLNGYDSPWIGGAGKNKLSSGDDYTYRGVTKTVNSDGSITLTGTATQTADMSVANAIVLETGVTYRMVIDRATGWNGTGNVLYVSIGNGSTNRYVGCGSSSSTLQTTFTLASDEYVGNCFLRVASGVNAGGQTVKVMIIKDGESTSYAPYENICPIYPANGKNLVESFNVGGGTRYQNYLCCECEFLPNTTYTISFIGTAGNRIYDNENLFTSSSIHVLPNGRFSVTLTTKGSLDKTNAGQYAEGKGWRVFKNQDTQTNPNTATDVQIELGSSVSPYQPYQGIAVQQIGRNLYPIAIGRDAFNNNVGGTHTTDSDILTITCTTATSSGVFASLGSEIRKVIADRVGQTITYSYDIKASVNTDVVIGYESTAYGRKSVTTEWQRIVQTGTVGATTAFVCYGRGTACTIQIKNFMFELGSEAHDYEPFIRNTYYMQVGQNVYGGSVDVATGVLTVDKVAIPMESISWQWNASYHIAYAYIADKKAGRTNLWSEMYKTVDKGYADMVSGEITGANNTGINVRDDRFTALVDFVTAVTGSKLMYVLATTTTVQLTSQQISLLTGINYISSSDEVTVTVSEPSLLENPTLFESKPLIRVYGHGTLTVNNQYITVAENPYEYIDIDCDIMDAFYGANNANRYVTLPNDYITLHSGNNYIAYDGTCEITPRWYEV